MKSRVAVSPEGLIPIETLFTFNKLKALTLDPAMVVAAAAASDDLKLSDDQLRVGRARPLPEHDTSAERTIYVEGFGYDNKNITLDTVRDMMAVYGDVAIVVLRKTAQRVFRGSVFVEFKTKAGADAAIAAANEIMYDGAPMSKVLTFAEHREYNKHEVNKLDAEVGVDAQDLLRRT